MHVNETGVFIENRFREGAFVSHLKVFKHNLYKVMKRIIVIHNKL